MSHLITPQLKELMDSAETKVSSTFNIPVKSLYNRSRDRKYSHARFAVFYLLNKVHKLSPSLIAQRYGMDVSSVVYGIETAPFYELPQAMGLESVNN